MSNTVALVGNPNCGKTTLFNVLTGSRYSVGNWPGVTVEKKEGKINDDLTLVDLPGIYSLTPYSKDEEIAEEFLLSDRSDLIVNIVDATNLERNLYLTSQLIETGKPVVLALNMIDELDIAGANIDYAKLSELIGVPVVPISALKEQGIQPLIYRIKSGIRHPKKVKWHYSGEIEKYIVDAQKKIEKESIVYKNYPSRFLAIKHLENDHEVNEVVSYYDQSQLIELENKIVADRYEHIRLIIEKTFFSERKFLDDSVSDKIDSVLTNKWFGIPIFAFVMYLVFQFTFSIGNIFLDIIDGFFSDVIIPGVINTLTSLGIAEWMVSMIGEGIFGGVGAVLTFLPNIIFLFIAIAILEDSGYMSRVAFILDRGLKKIGLSGKAFIPMVVGFGCNIPGIMATRTLRSETDRKISILVNPFMSCGARLPVYVLFVNAFFLKNKALVTYSLYMLGIVIAILMALIFKKTIFKGSTEVFMIELPRYRMPSVKNVYLKVWEQGKAYVQKAGSIILAASVILWFVLNLGPTGMTDMQNSYGAMIGQFISPIFRPLGFGDWAASLSLLTGIVAKEVVISNMAIIYGLGSSVAEAALEGSVEGFAPTLGAAFNQVSAYAFMVFVLLYTPCVATLAVVKREMNSYKWMWFQMFYQFVVAWIVAFLVYQVGSILFL
ncbi:MAG TPA: ferrous iron transport protein B [Clostridia bacterium]|nr:ferrous iron transport protein B [Clostridia bacterium]